MERGGIHVLAANRDLDVPTCGLGTVQAGASSGARMSVWAGRSVMPTGQVTPLGPWLQ